MKYIKAEIIVYVEDSWYDSESVEEREWFYSVLEDASSLYIPDVGGTIPCDVTKLEEIEIV